MAAWGVLSLGFFWTYWETLAKTVRIWWTTPDYGHGFFVPVFAGFLLWYRQEMVDPWPVRGSWWGLPFFAVFALFRWLNLFLNYERDIDSLMFFLLGMTLVLGGWRALRWAWPSILYLLFMVPLPDFVATALGGKLQRVATIMSVYVLQTCGIPALTSGEGSNVIQLSNPENQLEVARACCGLKMMTVFFAICVGYSLVLQAPVWKKIVLIVSAVPIAIISNVMRIVITGMLDEWWKPSVGEFVHDNAGWLMMVWAMLMIWGEMTLLSALLIEAPSEGPLSFGDGIGPARRTSPLANPLANPLAGPSGLGPSGLGPRKENPRSSPR
jgi:exosortase